MTERIIHIHIETAAETKNRLIAVARRLDKGERAFFW